MASYPFMMNGPGKISTTQFLFPARDCYSSFQTGLTMQAVAWRCTVPKSNYCENAMQLPCIRGFIVYWRRSVKKDFYGGGGMKILVCTDGSEHSQKALRQAAKIAASIEGARFPFCMFMNLSWQRYTAIVVPVYIHENRNPVKRKKTNPG